MVLESRTTADTLSGNPLGTVHGIDKMTTQFYYHNNVSLLSGDVRVINGLP